MFQTNNLYQNDPAWKDVPLGFPTEGGTIGSWGCLLTSITMMLNGLGYNETPVTVNDKMKQRSGFQSSMIIPSVVPAVFPGVVYKRFVVSENSPAPVDQISSAVSAGKPVIVQVDWSAASGIQTHWVLLKEMKGNDFVVYDPYRYPGDGPEKEVLLTKRYKFSGSELSTAILGTLFFDAYPAPAVTPIKPLPANAARVYVIEDALALRATGAFDGVLIKRLTQAAALTCLEAPEVVSSKLGQAGQWLNVQDLSGTQGYVAAWFVGAQLPTLPVTPAPTPGGGLVVTPTVDGLALRSQTTVSDASLIKRVPLGELLTVREPAEAAAARLGVPGAWIKVADSANVEGYVAAWYVKRADSGASTPPPPPVTPPPANAVVVKALSDQLALRSQPVISDTSLIKRLPVGARLVLTKPADANKIGISGQWLEVVDPANVKGWVAAWYVSR